MNMMNCQKKMGFKLKGGFTLKNKLHATIENDDDDDSDFFDDEGSSDVDNIMCLMCRGQIKI